MTNFGILLGRLARNETLSAFELDELSKYAKETQEVNSIISGNVSSDGRIEFPFPFFLLYSNNLGSDSTSVIIPVTTGYKHLLIIINGRINGSGGQVAVDCVARFNGDTGNNYDRGSVYQTGGTENATETISTSGIFFCQLNADGEANASFAGSGVIYIPNYESVFYKNTLSLSGLSTTTETRNYLHFGVWKNTARINSITLLPNPTYGSANIIKGTDISMYGIL